MKKEHVALTKCYFCNKNDKILLATKYINSEPVHDLADVHGKIIGMEPCIDCSKFMEKGIIVLTIDDSKSEEGWNIPNGKKNFIPNPYRTGGFFVIKESAIKEIFPEEQVNWALDHRFIFIEEEAARKVGFYEQNPIYNSVEELENATV